MELCRYKKIKKKYEALGNILNLHEYKLNMNKLFFEEDSLDEMEYDEIDDVQYIDLVYPPGCNPPTRCSVKNINYLNLNQFNNRV